jgi:hypothetical protein
MGHRVHSQRHHGLGTSLLLPRPFWGGWTLVEDAHAGGPRGKPGREANVSARRLAGPLRRGGGDGTPPKTRPPGDPASPWTCSFGRKRGMGPKV